MPKLFDLAVVTREYEDIRGNKKAVWENIGSLIEGKDGKKFIMLKAHFNPAAIQRRDGSECILVSLFAPKEKDSNIPSSSIDNSSYSGYSSNSDNQNMSSGNQVFDPDIPF